MIDSISGKVAIVTGGTRGIGRAIAQRLLSEGAAVAICGRSPEHVAQAVAELGSGGGKILGETADVSKLDDVREFFRRVDERFGAVDFLINNAGIGIYKPNV